ncbi:MAG TPA: serine/threonine-protein kinase [Polyangiaceae bacterium]
MLETGRTIAGKYRLNRMLGAGGMAFVWSATNVFTERDFAIKFMLPHVARTPEAAQRFLLEAKVSARINHPNIIEIIDVGQSEDGSLFLVMELLNGASLDVAMRRQQPAMTVHDLLFYMKDVAVALEAAHRSGVVHRDLKPTNIFLHEDRDGRVVPKLLDFGVSKVLEEEQNTGLTMAGTVLGSPHYMSPEQAMGASDIDGRTDVFAFGGILFEALTGRRAYEAPNFNALIVTIATKQPLRIDDMAPKLPEALRSLVRECLITLRESRIQSFDKVSERIAAMLPELAASDLRLPGTASVDPPVTMQVSTLPPSIAKPMDATFTGLQGVGSFVRGLQPRTMGLVGTAIGVAAVVLGVGLMRGRAASRTAAAESPAPVATAAAVAATQAPEPVVPPSAAPPPSAEPEAAGSTGVPTIAVDSLPTAARLGKGKGRLSITASPGWCSVSIDGVARGVTPMSGFEVRPGAHRVECVPPTGKPRIATVTVADGRLARRAFSLEE